MNDCSLAQQQPDASAASGTTANRRERTSTCTACLHMTSLVCLHSATALLLRRANDAADVPIGAFHARMRWRWVPTSGLFWQWFCGHQGAANGLLMVFDGSHRLVGDAAGDACRAIIV